MLATLKDIIQNYGLGTAALLVGLALIGWVARVSLKNPLTVVSDALKDVELARKALREELISVRAELHRTREELSVRDELIVNLNMKICDLEQKIDNLKG